MQHFVDFMSCFHLHHMPGVWQDMNIGPGQCRMRGRYDAIFLSPNHANWFTELGNFFPEHYPLLISVEKCGENRFQSGLDSIQALKSKQLFDQLARHQSFVCKQASSKGFQPPCGCWFLLSRANTRRQFLFREPPN